MAATNDDWATLAPYLRAQRQMARLSLRSLATMTGVSDSYLSQVERGLHQPSPEVLKAMASALGMSANSLYERMGWLDSDEEAEANGTATEGVEMAIERDERLTPSKKTALLRCIPIHGRGRLALDVAGAAWCTAENVACRTRVRARRLLVQVGSTTEGDPSWRP